MLLNLFGVLLIRLTFNGHTFFIYDVLRYIYLKDFTVSISLSLVQSPIVPNRDSPLPPVPTFPRRTPSGYHYFQDDIKLLPPPVYRCEPYFNVFLCVCTCVITYTLTTLGLFETHNTVITKGLKLLSWRQYVLQM